MMMMPAISPARWIRPRWRAVIARTVAILRDRRPVAHWNTVSGRKATSAAAPRPLRAAVVPARLDDLSGPSAGVVDLPVRLYWSAGSRQFDLSDPDQVAAMYDAVLDAASTVRDITTFLNADLLVSVWPVLGMGRIKREAWENRFPVLRRRRLAAAA